MTRGIRIQGRNQLPADFLCLADGGVAIDLRCPDDGTSPDDC